MDHRQALLQDTVLDSKYRIARAIGAGGFGITYEAFDLGLKSRVAIKEYYPSQFGVRDSTFSVRPRSHSDAQLFDRLKTSFLREARTLAQFDHPAIVRVLNVFAAHGTAYMVMRFESGVSLKAWLAELPRAPTQAELDRLTAYVLDALEVMHAAEFVHRDVAPDNIVIRADGSPVLLDFGASRRIMGDVSGTLTGVVKKGYSPPEQYTTDLRAQGPWTDIYALAATLYEAITGARPTEASERMLEDSMPQLSIIARGSYRAGFLEAIDHALSLKPRDRPQTIAEWRRALSVRAVDTDPPRGIGHDLSPLSASALAQVSQPLGGAAELRSKIGSRQKPLLFAALASIALIGGVMAASRFTGSTDPTARWNDDRKDVIADGERLAREAAGRKEEEARRIAAETAARRAREETERLAKEEAARKAEEARRVAAEATDRREREEAERLAKQEAAREAEEAQRGAAETAARREREETERLAKEEAARKAEQARRVAAEVAARRERDKAERLAKQEAARKSDEAARYAREETERLAKEASAREVEDRRRVASVHRTPPAEDANEETVIADIRRQLNRVGCSTSARAPTWQPADQKALEQFAQHSGGQFSFLKLSSEISNRIATFQQPVCPPAVEQATLCSQINERAQVGLLTETDKGILRTSKCR